MISLEKVCLWVGEVKQIFSCETYEDEIEANLDMKLSVSWKEFIYKNDVESLLWIPRGWNKAEYGYTDIVGHSCFEGWSVSLAFHSLVPHNSSSVQWGAGWESSMD